MVFHLWVDDEVSDGGSKHRLVGLGSSSRRDDTQLADLVPSLETLVREKLLLGGKGHNGHEDNGAGQEVYNIPVMPPPESLPTVR